MKEVIKGRRNGIQWTPWIQYDDLDFADDLMLISHVSNQMQNKTDDLNTISKSCGLNMHKIKTKVMKNKAAAGSDRILLEGIPLEEVDSFCYLGSMTDGKGGTEADIKARIAKARAAFNQLGKIWRTSTISKKTKLIPFHACAVSVLLNGCKT